MSTSELYTWTPTGPYTWTPTGPYTWVSKEVDAHAWESVEINTTSLIETTWNSAEPSSSPSSSNVSPWNSAATSNISSWSTTAHITFTGNTTVDNNGNKDTSTINTIAESAGSYTYITPATIPETTSGGPSGAAASSRADISPPSRQT
ncbi:hypothetical protein F4820DRAFT_452289 [Hypoxylon rubiginosum]|uniref:Uncharacterized protein n=1 Tax=Hypoxylon rubiginosum TaxID=110542 RepID=A0ACB9YQL3_9PEZI|nr:hypothetical protein F4820DRAFT_452289 [Hypoxylon rubiginosum]